MSTRVVVEIRQDLHKELRKIAVLNDLKIYELVNAVLEELLNDEERLKLLLKTQKKVSAKKPE
jgi:hypothetical protein